MTNILVTFSPKAQGEVQHAYDWYNKEQDGLGEEFTRQLMEFCKSLGDFPRKFKKIQFNIRMAMMPKFPYCIYFEIRDECVWILSVVHGKRHPNSWKKK